LNDQVVILQAYEVGRYRWWKRLGCLLVVVLLGGAGLVLGGLGYSVHQQIQREGGGLSDTWMFLRDPRRYVFGNRSRLNILCLGVDYNHDSKGIQHTKGARSDTLIVLSLDADSKRVSALSLPRDLRLFLGDAHGHDKVNAAFSYGGARLSRQVIARFLQIPLDYVLVVRVDAARELVDALGGLQVRVEKDMDYDDNWGNLHIHLKKGLQRLNGRQVVGYCRFRHDEESDFGRMRRQQQVLRTVSQHLSHNISPETLERLVQIVRRNVSSDMSYSKMLTLARLFRGLDASRIRTQSLAVQDDPGSFDLLPVPEKNRAQLEQLLGR
jgi:LCP family protein required for cell wall assembly